MTTDYAGATWRPALAFRAGRRRRLESIILHASDGREAGDIETLTGAYVSSHYYVTRAGHVWQFVREADTAYHAGVVLKNCWSNAATIGIEQEHVDGRQDWPEAQLRAVANLVSDIRRRNPGPMPVLGHATVAAPPGRKIDPAGYPWAELHKYVTEAYRG